MADKAAAADPAAGGEEEKDGGEPKKSCGQKYEDCIIFVCKWTYKIILGIVTAIRSCIAFFWYPCKEQCTRCHNCCDKCLNPWKDEGYTNV